VTRFDGHHSIGLGVLLEGVAVSELRFPLDREPFAAAREDPVCSSSASRAPLRVPPNVLARRRAKGRRVVVMGSLMAKIRKWLGLGKKS
jgi:hypothetical protein